MPVMSPWPASSRLIAIRMDRQGASHAEIGAAVGKSKDAVRYFFRLQRDANLNARRRKRYATKREAGLTSLSRRTLAAHYARLLDGRDLRANERAALDTTAILMGDPTPSRSALGASPLNPQIPSHGEVPL